MHIVYLVVSANKASGGMRVIFEHANRLQQRDHKVEIWTAEPLRKAWFPCQVPIHFIDNVKFQPIDILVITDASFLFNDFWRRISSKKYFFLAQHDLELIYRANGSNTDADQLNDLFLHKFPKEVQTITVSEWVKERFLQKYRINSIVIRNGIDRNFFHPTAPLVAGSLPKLIYFYDPEAWKGANEASLAINIITKELPNIRIIIVGGVLPLMPENLRPSSQTVGWSFHWPVIYFNHPSQHELAEIYSSATVFMSPSWYEGFGLPGLEALACGVPVVTTDSGGVREYAISEETAVVVPPKDPKALAEGVLRVLRDEKLRRKLIKNGLEKVKKFDWKDQIDKLEEIFRSQP